MDLHHRLKQFIIQGAKTAQYSTVFFQPFQSCPYKLLSDNINTSNRLAYYLKLSKYSNEKCDISQFHIDFDNKVLLKPFIVFDFLWMFLSNIF